MIKDKIAKWLGIEPEIRFMDRPVEKIVYKPKLIVKEVNWTQDHVRALATVLKSPMGKELLAIMDNTEMRANSYAVSSSIKEEAREFKMGLCHGIALAFQKLRNLAAIQEEAVSDDPTEEEIEKYVSDRVLKRF